jgi:hypothetical protein
LKMSSTSSGVETVMGWSVTIPVVMSAGRVDFAPPSDLASSTVLQASNVKLAIDYRAIFRHLFGSSDIWIGLACR